MFSNGGPYTDLYLKSPKEAKTDGRLKSSGELKGFHFESIDYPLGNDFTFYDYIYISALNENPILAGEIIKYSAFTDIIFTPQKSINCQAKSAAIFKSLYNNDLLNTATDFVKISSLCESKIF